MRIPAGGYDFGTFLASYQGGQQRKYSGTDDDDTSARTGVDALRNRALVVKVNRLFRP